MGKRARGEGYEGTHNLNCLAEDFLGFLDVSGAVGSTEALQVSACRVSPSRVGSARTDHGTKSGTREFNSVEGDVGRHSDFSFF